MSNFSQGCSSYCMGLKFGQILFFWVGKFFSYFSGFRKISATFWFWKNFQLFFLSLTNFQLFFGSSNFCITHLNPLNEEHSTEKQNRSTFSYLFKL